MTTSSGFLKGSDLPATLAATGNNIPVGSTMDLRAENSGIEFVVSGQGRICPICDQPLTLGDMVGLTVVKADIMSATLTFAHSNDMQCLAMIEGWKEEEHSKLVKARALDPDCYCKVNYICQKHQMKSEY